MKGKRGELNLHFIVLSFKRSNRAWLVLHYDWFSDHLPCTVFLKAVYFFSGMGSSLPFDNVTVKRLILVICIGFTR